MELRPCAQCRRHVQGTASVCPFCSAKISFAPALLIAGLMAVSGCDKKGGAADAPDPKTQPDPNKKVDTPKEPDEPVRAIYAGPPPDVDPKPEADIDVPADIYGGPPADPMPEPEAEVEPKPEAEVEPEPKRPKSIYAGPPAPDRPPMREPPGRNPGFPID